MRKAEAFSEPCQTYKMVRFAKIANNVSSLLRKFIHELVLGVMKIWKRRKKWKVDSISRFQEQIKLIVSR